MKSNHDAYRFSNRHLFAFLIYGLLYSALNILPAHAQEPPIVAIEQIPVIGSTMVEPASPVARISAEGRYLAYWNPSDNDVAENHRIYHHDRNSGTSILASVASDGTEADPDFQLGLADMSADGRFVVFNSGASNLVANDTNGHGDIFVHDTVTGETKRVNVSSTGVQTSEVDAGSNGATISDDGRFVAFVSIASNIVPTDTNGSEDNFVHDTVTGETTIVSISSNGTIIGGQEHTPGISADARIVAFTSEVGSSFPLSAHDRLTGETTLISKANDGSSADAGDRGPGPIPSLSGDGRFVGFRSWENIEGVIPERDGTTDGIWDSYIHDRMTRQSIRVNSSVDGLLASVTCGGRQSGETYQPLISAGGRYAVYDCLASNLVASDSNDAVDVFVFDKSTGEITRISVALDGSELGDSTFLLDITPDMKFVLVKSSIRNYVPGNLSADPALFLLELALAPNPLPAPTGSFPVAIIDRVTANTDTNVTIDVLANDQGVDDAPLIVNVEADPSNGTTVVASDNKITFTPNIGFTGEDRFNYSVVDRDGDLSFATVVATVTDPALPPPPPPPPIVDPGGGSGGCTVGPSDGTIDPTLPILLLISLGYLLRRRFSET